MKWKSWMLSPILLAACAVLCPAQQWEFGGTGGASYVRGVPVAAAAGAATAGFRTGPAFGVFFAQNAYSHVSGELHYALLNSELLLQSGGSEASFTGIAHVVHYDLVLRASNREAPVQVFAAIGGGVKVFQGTGREAAYQPLSEFGYFTKTRAVKPMASIGAGVKYRMTPKVFLRTEVRDYITPFPTEIITPAPGADYGSFLHDIVPMAGLSIQF